MADCWGVLRVPIGDGNMGKLFAVAMTPDGNTVALGGWTSALGAQDIYLLDRTSGTLRRRLLGLPNVVNHLAYSLDGRFLVGALGGSNGIRVYDASREYEPLPSDADYGNSSDWADFDQQGRLVTTSDDGFIRLYATGKYDKPIAKVKGRGGKHPFAAVFSPDGQRVVVGYDESPAVDLVSGRDLSFLKALDTSGIAENEISSTGWSNDGRYLFACGKGGQVRRWEKGGTGRHVDIEAANDTVMQLLPLKNGGMLFATADPAFGIIDAQGRAKMLQGPGQLVFWGTPGSLRVSSNSQIVEKGTNLPRHTIRFALAERRLDVDPPADKTLTAPLTKAPGLKLTGWQDGYHPAVDGRPLVLDSYEFSEA